MRTLILGLLAMLTVSCGKAWEVESKLAEYEGNIITVDSCLCIERAKAEARAIFDTPIDPALCDVVAYEARLTEIEQRMAARDKFGVHVRTIGAGWIEDLFFFDGDDGIVYNKAFDCFTGTCKDRRGWASMDASRPSVSRLDALHTDCAGRNTPSFMLRLSSDGDHSHIPQE